MNTQTYTHGGTRHPAIGELCKGSFTVFYAYVNGVYREGPIDHLNCILEGASKPTVSANRRQDRVYFVAQLGAYPLVGSRAYDDLPRVRLTRDWGSYMQGTMIVVCVQMNCPVNGLAIYRGMLEGETMPDGEMALRSIPAEVCELVFPVAEAVRRVRQAAEDEARAGCRYVRSRGTFLGTSEAGGVCQPHEPGDCHEWRGTMKDLRGVVADVKANYPNVTEVFLVGGFDGSCDDGTTLRQWLKHDCDYVPWASSWELTVWTQADGWLFGPEAREDARMRLARVEIAQEISA